MSLVGSEQNQTVTEAATAVVTPPLGQGALVAAERRPAQAELPQVLATTPTVIGLLHALRRRWCLALFFGLLAAGAASSGVWFAQPEKFIGRTTVYISDSSILGQASNRQDQRTQVAVARGRMVLNAALRDPKVAELAVVKEAVDPLNWLERQIGADFAIAPEIFRIFMTGERPEEVTAIINAVRDCYLKEIRRLEVDAKQQRVDKLSEIYADISRKLEDKKLQLKRMAENLGSTKDAKIQERRQEMYWKSLDFLQSDLLQTQAKLRNAEMELTIHQTQDPKGAELPIPPTAIEELIDQDPEVQKRIAILKKYNADLATLAKNLFEPEKDKDYQRILAERDAAQKVLATHQERVRKELDKNIRQEIEGSNVVRKQTVVLLQKQVKYLGEEVDKRLVAFQELNRQRINVEWLQDEIKLDDDLARKLALQKQLLDVEMQSPDRYRVMEEAFCVPDTDTRIKKASTAGFGAFGFIVLAIALLEFRSRKVNSADELVRGLKIRLVGALPNLPSRSGQYGQGKRDRDVRWQNRMAESVQSARTMLLHSAQTDALRVIAVTSAVGGEGKTLTCSHLAASLARAGRKTLLIDADLRRPSLQKLFSLAEGPGFSELLRGETQIPAAVQATPIDGLSIISAGVSDAATIQALAQPVFGELMKQLREQYDFVIVDTAPILPVADSQMICQHADGVIFAILRDVSRLPQIYAAHERLMALRVRILGAVLNGTDGPVYGSSYTYSRANHA
jgi:capsular exopolysaccharide synthesis family protein